MTYKVFIDGAEGTTGLHLKQRLLLHPEICLLEIDEKKRKNSKERLKIFSEANLVFLCLPDHISIETRFPRNIFFFESFTKS